MFVDEKAIKLDKSLKQLGGVFDFAVFHLDDLSNVNEETHKLALTELFKRVKQETQAWQEEVLKRYPEYKESHFKQLYSNINEALSRTLSRDELLELVKYKDRKQGKAPLFRAFYNPPYSMKITELEAIDKFKFWLEFLGLMPDENIQVVDWVGDPDKNPERSTWSNYFDEGKEWWGIWCLTTYNPKRKTISALMASATD